MGKKRINIKTKLIHSGINPNEHQGSLSNPIYKNSTLVFKDYDGYLDAKKNKFSKPYYGRLGNVSTKAFEALMSELYECDSCIATSSGLSAIILSLLTFLEKDSECLITENCYEPVYNFATNTLKKLGINVKYFSNINFNKLVSKKTRVIYMESPGSLNYKIEDVKKIVNIAKKKKIVTIFDNTWATFLGFNPLKLGVDVVIESATKYISGHSDNFCGIIATDYNNFVKIKTTITRHGDYVHPESCNTAMRGIKTLNSRMKVHYNNAQKIYSFLQKKKIVQKIYFPPNINDSQHLLWKNYFTSGNGLLSFSMLDNNDIRIFLNNLKLFQIGFSWGGFESLILPINRFSPVIKHSKKSLHSFRIHAGLESSDDLIDDLERGFLKYEER